MKIDGWYYLKKECVRGSTRYDDVLWVETLIVVLKVELFEFRCVLIIKCLLISI